MVELAHLVALQVADEMPTDWHFNRAHLAERFLNLVLADVLNARVPRSVHRIGPMRLRDRDDRNTLSVPSARHRRRHPSAHLRQPSAEVLK